MITGTEVEYQSDAGSTKDNPYLALTGELWDVFCEYLWEKWPRYNGTALYCNRGFQQTKTNFKLWTVQKFYPGWTPQIFQSTETYSHMVSYNEENKHFISAQVMTTSNRASFESN